MTSPTPEELHEVVESTWAARSKVIHGPWTIRDGAGGGKRVSAATANEARSMDQIDLAERAMVALGQSTLFMIRNGENELDRALAERGYIIVDPVKLYLCETAILIEEPLPKATGFSIWPPLAIQNEIWAKGGIETARLEIMERVACTKSSFLLRGADRAAGTAFVAIHENIAMIHAIEVLPEIRRQGVGASIMQLAAHWAMANGARYFSLAVTGANTSANSLYSKLGMSVAGEYHYRLKQT